MTRLSTSATTAGPPEVVRCCGREIGLGEDRPLDEHQHVGRHLLHARHAEHDFGAERRVELFEHTRRVMRLEVRENERDGLRMFTAQHVAELLRVGVAKTMKTGRFGDLRRDAAQDRFRFLRSERALQHFAGELHTAGGDRIRRHHHFDPLGEDRLRGFVAHAVHPRDLERDLFDLFLAELLRDHRGRFRPQHHAENRRLLRSGQLVELMRADERVCHGLSLLQPRADDARGDIGLLLDRRVHFVAHRIGRHHHGYERPGADHRRAGRRVVARKRHHRGVRRGGGRHRLQRLEAHQHHHRDQRETNDAEKRTLRGLHDLHDVRLRRFDGEGATGANGTLTTETTSPRVLSKPTALRTSIWIWSSSARGRGAGAALLPAGGGRSATSTATVRRLIAPVRR